MPSADISSLEDLVAEFCRKKFLSMQATFRIFLLTLFTCSAVSPATAGKYSTEGEYDSDPYDGIPTPAEQREFDALTRIEALEAEAETLRDALRSGRSLTEQRVHERKLAEITEAFLALSLKKSMGGEQVVKNIKFCGRTWYGRDYCNVRPVSEFVPYTPSQINKIDERLDVLERQMKYLSDR